MNNIQLNIVANAQFQQVYAEVAKLKEAMASLQKVSVGGPFAPGITSEIKNAQSAFDSAIQSTRAFTIQHVAMTDSVTKFGKQLEAGKLSLNQYYKIWRDNVNGVSKELDTLAQQQARLNRSVAIVDPLRPGYAKLVTDINGVVTAQEKQIFYQKALNTALHDGSMKLIDFGKNTQWMGRQLTVGLTMPIAMFGAGIATAFNNVDKELTRMQKVYGTGLIQPTQEALKQIRTDVQALGNELARTLGTSVQETASMAADLAATGLEGQKLLGATKEAIRLATLGELDHQQAMQATISLQNVYKLSTQGLSEAVNFLNAVENQTSTSLQDLVDAIPRVGPIVQQLGGSFKDTAAMMVAMKEAGVPAAQGANAIKSALSSLINPTKNAQNAFSAYHISLSQIATETGGKPILMLKALADQMKSLDKLAQAQLIEKLFGKFQFARIQALLDNINKAGSQTATVFNLMGASTTDLATLAANELKQQTESASGKFKRMVETVKADLLPLGQAFLNSFTRIGNIADKVLNVFQKMAHTLGPLSTILGKVFGTGFAGLVLIGPILMLTGLFANLIGNLLKGANYIRMFRQGMEQASTTQSKFAAGIQNLRNFYENLDLGMVASRRQLDLMPEAITSNAKAFDILTASIRTLTAQFEAFAMAQAQAMGHSLPTGLNPAGQPKWRGFATGGYVPGSGNTDSFAAMLTPGEAVIPKANAAKYAPVVDAIMRGTLPGFNGGSPSVSIGSTSQLRRALGFSKYQRSHIGDPSDFEGRTGGAILMLEDFVNQQTKTGRAGLSAQEIGASIQTQLAEGIHPASAMFAQLTDMQKKGLITQEEYNKAIDSLHEATLKMVADFNEMDSSVKFGKAAGQTSLEKKAMEYYADPLRNVGLTSGQSMYDYLGRFDTQRSGKTKGVTYLDPSGELRDLGKTEASFVGTMGTSTTLYRKLKNAANRLMGNMQNTVADEMNILSDSHSDSKKTKQSAKNVVGGFINEVNDSKYVKQAAEGAARISEQLMFPGMTGPTFLGSTIPLRAGMAPKAGGFGRLFSNPMTTMAMSMIAPMAMSMIPDKVAGTDISGFKSTTQSALGMGTMAASLLQFSQFAKFAGPVGLAVGGLTAALGGLQLAFKNSDQAAQKAADAIVKNYQNAADKINAGRVSETNATQTQINIQEVQLKTYTKLTDAQNKAKDSADKLAQSYDNISKATTLQQQILAGQALGSAQAQGANSFGNQVRSLLFGTSSQSNLSTGATRGLLPVLFPGLKAKDTGYYQSMGQSQLLGQLTAKPTSFEKLTDPAYLSNITDRYIKVNGKVKENSQYVDASTQKLIANKQTYALWNAEVAKTNAPLARLNEQLEKNGISLQNIIQLNQAFAAGFFESTNAIDWASTHMKQFQNAFKVYQEKIKQDVAKAKAQLAVDQAKADELNKIAQGDTFTAEDAAKVKADEAAIKAIEKQVKARNDLYNSQMRNIDAQQQQMNLEAEVVKARGSGDLVAMAVAKQNLQIQRTKDAMAAAKDRADRGSQAKIDALQAEIDKLNAKKQGVGSQAAKDAASAANQKVQADQEALAKALTGGGTNAQGYKDAFDAAHRPLPAAPGKGPIPVLGLLMPKWLKEFKWPEFKMPEWLKTIKEKLKFEMPEWLKNIKEKLKLPEFKMPKWFESIKNFKWPEIKLPAGLEKIFKLGGKVENIVKSPIKGITNVIEKIGETGVGKVIGKLGKGAGVVGAALNTFTGYQNAKSSGKFNLGELGKSTATSAAWGAALGTIIPGAGTIAGTVSGAAWGAGTDLAGQLLGLLLGGNKTTSKTTTVENKGKVENKNTGPQTTTNTGNHTNNNKGNHTNNNTGSHTNKNSGKVTQTNTASTTVTHTGSTAVTAAKSSITASSSNITAAKSSITASGSGISAPNATISGPINAKVNVTVNVTTSTTKKARGGFITAASGLLVGEGTATSDSIPAMLSNGEYVINAASVSKYGSHFMDKINTGTFDVDGIKGYAPSILNAANNKKVDVPSYSLNARKVGDIANVVGNTTSNITNNISVNAPAGADVNAIANLVVNKLNQAMSKQVTRRSIK